MKKSFLRKIFTVISALAILTQSLTPYLVLLPQSAYAQTATPTNTPTPTPTNTVSPTPTPAATPTPTPTVTPTPTNTPTPTPTLIDTLTPTPTATPTPTNAVTPAATPSATGTVTPTPTPVDNLSPPPTPTPADNPSAGPGQVQGVQTSITPSPTATSTPTPASNAANTTPATGNEQVNLVILKNVSAPAIDLSATVSQGSAVLTTNKPDYAPTDTALITGKNFNPGETYTLLITSVNNYSFSTQVTADSKGDIAYAYQLDGTYRPTYTVQAIDSTGKVVATTTFTDSPAPSNTKLNQWETLPSGNWITGALNSSNSNYLEGETVPFELDLGTIATSGNPYTFSVCRDYQSGTHFGYISLLPFNTSRSAIPDGSISTTNTPFSGSNISSISFTEVGAQGGCDAGQRETQLSINVTNGSTNTYLLWGGKLASPDDPGVGVGNGASSYPGGSLHMHLLSPKKDVGIQTNAIIPLSTITIHKTTVPSGGTGFGFTTTGGLSPSTFSLNDGGNTSYTTVVPGTYTITENDPSGSGYSLTGLTCGTVSGTGTSATPTLGTRTVSITIGAGGGGNVDCTYTNTKNKVTPTISTTPSEGGNIGIVLNDSALLSSGFNPTGSIIFKLFSPSDATCSTSPVYTSTVSISGNNTYSSIGGSTTGSNTGNTVGTYHWTASYGGDSFNNPVSSGCADEAVTITKAAPTLTTNASGPVIVASNITDTAHLSGGFGTLGGTITFDVFAPGDTTCTTPTSVPPSKTVTGGGDYTSSNYTTSTAGTYRWIAHYSGDSNNNAVNTACNDANESSTVNKTNPTINTTLSGTSVDVGTSVHDSSAISGATSNASGTVTYSVYTDNSCTTLYTNHQPNGNPVTVTNGVVPDSGNVTFDQAGTYYWQAVYSGDTNNNSATSSCGSETITVNKVAPTLTTTASGPVTVGSNIHDVAHLSGGFGTLGGSITFDVFAVGDTSCTTPISVPPTKTVAGTGDYTSDNYVTSAVGDYRWIAHYSGDSNNNAVNTACNDSNESSATQKATPNIQTTPSSGGVVGIQIHDSASVTGGFNPTGNVTFNLYDVNDATCSIKAVYTDTESLTSGSSTSGNFSTLKAGTYHWTATYNGDASNNSVTSGCADEAVTITKSSPTLTTSIHDPNHNVVTSTDAGSTVHDSAAISGGFSPTGNVDFTFYTSADCTTGGSATGTGIALVSGIAHPSSSEGPLNAGSYSFKAHYNGDTNNNTADSSCEPLTVNQLTPNVSTIIHLANGGVVSGPVALGTSVSDEADVTGSFGVPSGNVDFTFYNNGACTPDGTGAGSVALDESGVASPSNSEGSLSTGSYSFKAHYNGDTNYVAGDSGCEPLTVNKAQLGVNTAVHDTNHNPVTTVDLGSVVHDTATVTGSVDGFSTSPVTFTFFNNGTCEGDGSSVANTGADGAAVRSADSSPLGAGTYSYQASVADNSNYTGATGDCEPLTVNQSKVTVTTQVHDSQENVIGAETLGFNVHDKATVTGGVEGFSPTGTVDFTFFSGTECDSEGTSAGTITLDENGIAHPSTTETLTTAGLYSFQAHYNGDSNYQEQTSTCEPFTLTTLQLNKNANGGNGTFNFTVDGPTPFTPSIKTSEGTGQTAVVPILSGTYSATEASQTGWDQTGAVCGEGSPTDSYTISAGDAGSCTFTNDKRGKVIVTKYLDDDANGTKDTGEEVISDWTINLSGNGSQVTNANGQAKFDNVLPDSYTLSENFPDKSWNQSNITCDNGTYDAKNGTFDLTVEAGQTVNCSVGNYKKAHITVNKVLYQPDETTIATNDNTQFNFNVTNNNDVNNSFPLQNGGSQAYDVKPGTYDVSEFTPNQNYSFLNCKAVYGNQSIGSPIAGGEKVVLGSNDAVTVTCYNAQQYGHITGDKFNDIIGKGQECSFNPENQLNPFTCQPKLPNWTIQLFQNDGGDLGTKVSETTTDTNGKYSFDQVVPGSYFVCELPQNGWQQTYPFDTYSFKGHGECYLVNVTSGFKTEGQFNFGNHNLTPKLTISKSNDASGNKAPGDTVAFTIVISDDPKAGPADNVKVTDLLPKGFHYNSGSWSANSSIHGVLSLSEPTYASPGVWTIGHMDPGEVVTLKYKVTIDGGQATGTYFDNAWGVGNPVGFSTQVFALAVDPGNLDSSNPDNNFVGTQVSVVNGSQPGVNYKATSTKEVLGASTGPELPATGEPTLWVIIATLMSIFGFGSLILGVKLRRKYEKN